MELDNPINLGPETVKWISTTDFSSIGQSEDYEFDHVVKIWDTLSKIQKNVGKPEKFATIILAYSTSVNYSDAIEEWIPKSIDMNIYSNQCICSQRIERNYIMYNKLNHNSLIIGSECINKFGSENARQIHKIRVKHERYTETGGTKRQCAGCGNHRISSNKPDWLTLCKSCYRNGNESSKTAEAYRQSRNYRECKGCGENKIPDDAEHYITHCKPCYTELKNSNTSLKTSNTSLKNSNDELKNSNDKLKIDNITSNRRKCVDCDELIYGNISNTNGTIRCTLCNRIYLTKIEEEKKAINGKSAPFFVPLTVVPSTPSTFTPIRLNTTWNNAFGSNKTENSNIVKPVIPTSNQSFNLFKKCISCPEMIAIKPDWKKECLTCYYKNKK
jgi:hypothetical protein